MKEAEIGTVEGYEVKVFAHNGVIRIAEPGRLGVDIENPDSVAELAELLHKAAAKAAKLQAAVREWEVAKLRASDRLAHVQNEIIGEQAPK
jgi:hypothetical protein